MLFRSDSNLEHLHHLSSKAANPDESMRPLLRVGADEEEGGVVLGCPEGDGGRVFKRADGVGFGEGDGVGLLELVLRRV